MRQLCWMSTNIPPLGTVKQTWIQRFPAEEQKWSPETHAVNLRHDNNKNSSNSNKIQKPVHQPKDAEASTTSQSAEEQSSSWEEPISLSAAVLLSRWATTQRAEAEQENTLGNWCNRGSRDVCWKKRRSAVGQRRTFMVMVEMRRGEGKEGGERVWTWLTDPGNGWRTCVKSLFEVFKDRICVCAVLRFLYQQLAFKIPSFYRFITFRIFVTWSNTFFFSINHLFVSNWKKGGKSNGIKGKLQSDRLCADVWCGEYLVKYNVHFSS